MATGLATTIVITSLCHNESLRVSLRVSRIVVITMFLIIVIFARAKLMVVHGAHMKHGPVLRSNTRAPQCGTQIGYET